MNPAFDVFTNYCHKIWMRRKKKLYFCQPNERKAQKMEAIHENIRYKHKLSNGFIFFFFFGELFKCSSEWRVKISRCHWCRSQFSMSLSSLLPHKYIKSTKNFKVVFLKKTWLCYHRLNIRTSYHNAISNKSF